MKLNLRLLLVIAAWIALAVSTAAQNSPIRVACVGNSITQGYGTSDSRSYPQQLGALLGSKYTVRNFGVGGRTLLKKGDFPYWNEPAFIDAQGFDPQILIISLGTNDSKSQNWIYKNEFYSDYMDFVSTFRQNGKHPQIFVCIPPPVFIDNFGITESIIRDEIDPLIDSVRSTAHTFLIDFHTPMLDDSAKFQDGVHPNQDGYAIMGQIAYDAIVNTPAGFIRDFRADPPTFELGESVILRWETTKGSQVTINGSAVNETDSMTVTPTQTTSYTMIATGSAFADTAHLTVQYFPPGTIKSFRADFSMLDEGAGDSTLVFWTTAKGSSVSFENQSVSPNSSRFVSPPSTTTYVLIATGVITDTGRVTVRLLPADQINRALGRSVFSQSSSTGYSPTAVVDGDTTTLWMSDVYSNAQWFLCDLKRICKINKVVLYWGTNYASTYRLAVSRDSAAWSLVKSVLAGKGGVEILDNLSGTGRYFKLLLDKRDSTTSGYKLRELEIYGTLDKGTAVQQRGSDIPQQYALYQNSPNPFNPSTVIRFALPVRSFVRMEIYNILGQKITRIVDSSIEAGEHSIAWTAHVPSGLYICRIDALSIDASERHFQASMKMIVLK
jgi:lysophospholipase L1-like esterase